MNARMLERRFREDAFAKFSVLKQSTIEIERRAAAERVELDLRAVNEQLIISNKQLAVANIDLETFSYSIAHDLRSPIRQIAGFSKILVEEYAAQLPREAQGYLDKITQGTRQMSCLIDDMLRLAQVGKRSMSLQVVSLNSIVAAAMEIVGPDCIGRSIKWQIENLGDIACDQGLMTQVFVNLLSNAIKYTRPRDPAVIAVGQMTIEGASVFFVRDNGVGFDMKNAGKLFEVFQRMHSAFEFEGTGIGLATVERIVRKHGGQIWASAEIGRGATVFFTVSTCAFSGRELDEEKTAQLLSCVMQATAATASD